MGGLGGEHRVPHFKNPREVFAPPLPYRHPVPTTTGWLVLLATALVGSTLGGVVGFGAGVLLLPVAGSVLGLRAAVPVLTVTMLIGNLSRIWLSRGEIDGAVVRRYLAAAIPASALGALVFAGARIEWLSWVIAAFLILALPLRRILERYDLRPGLRHFPVLGGIFGFLSSIVVTTGPIVTPFFLAYGLRRGAFIGTESVCALGMHVTRAAVFARYALLTWETVAVGLVLGTTMFAGAWAGRRMVDRLSERAFTRAVEALLVLMGLKLLLFPG